MFVAPENLIEQIDPDLNYLNEIFESINSSKQSCYISVEESNSLISDKTFFSILTYNIRSFNANSDSFFSMFNDNKNFPDILCLTETWFQDGVTEDISEYISYHTIRDSGRSGGVSIFIKSNFNSKLISQFSFSNIDIEVCTIEVILNNKPVILIGIYRPHSGTIFNFNNVLNSILDNNTIRGKLCILLGDFNINILNDDVPVNSFIHNLQSGHFYPLVTKPTRFSNQDGISPSLLDHVWFNSLDHNYVCSIILNDFTDHLPVLFQVNLNHTSTSEEKIKITFRCDNQSNRNLYHDRVLSYN